MRGTTDASIWDYAKKHGFAIVSKDNDFRQRAFVYGALPQVTWLSIGNAGTWYSYSK
jgi:predicted nuclease of predicted toxin-antitoxin system